MAVTYGVPYGRMVATDPWQTVRGSDDRRHEYARQSRLIYFLYARLPGVYNEAMTGLNHALVGSLLATAMPLPLAIPAAFVSHFCLDALPHFGIPGVSRDTVRPWGFVLAFDTALTVSLMVYLVAFNRWDMVLCAIVAISPDVVWLKKLVRNQTLDFLKDSNWLTRFHHLIQRYELRWGLLVEVPLAAALFIVLANALHVQAGTL